MTGICFCMMPTGSSMEMALTPKERSGENQFLWIKADPAE